MTNSSNDNDRELPPDLVKLLEAIISESLIISWMRAVGADVSEHEERYNKLQQEFRKLARRYRPKCGLSREVVDTYG